jgi:hypothetical protein
MLKPHIRRPLAVALAVAGAVLIFLTPATWAGAALLALGIALEALGVAHQTQCLSGVWCAFPFPNDLNR